MDLSTKEAFLSKFRATGDKAKALKELGISEHRFNHALRSDEDFNQSFSSAYTGLADLIQTRLIDNILNGDVKTKEVWDEDMGKWKPAMRELNKHTSADKYKLAISLVDPKRLQGMVDASATKVVVEVNTFNDKGDKVIIDTDITDVFSEDANGSEL